jgi:NADPH:quinone reductase-like Zn-dependent oxidoreductase
VPEVGPGQVLIRVEASVINPADLMYMTGNYGSKPTSFPARVGFEGCGRVVSSGGGVVGWMRMGKRVSFATGGVGGAWAEYVAVPATHVVPVPDELPLDQAAAAFINPLTVVGFFDEVSAGSHKAIVLTAAASQVGRMVNRVARLRGIPVVNIVRKPEQAQVLTNEGAQYTLLESEPAFNEKFEKLCAQLSATIFFDAVAGPQTGHLLHLMPDRSTAVVYGGLSGAAVSQGDPRDFIFHMKQIKGFWLSEYLNSKTTIGQMAAVREATGLLGTSLATTFSGRVQLRDLPQAIQDYSKNMTAGKKLILVSGDAH